MKNFKKWIRLSLYFTGILFFATNSFADEFTSALNSTRAKVGFYLYDISGQRIVSSYKPERPLKPASLLKIITTYASLKNLGPEWTAKTRVYAEGIDGNTVDRLIVVGGGDPSMDLGSLWNLAREVKKARIKKIKQIVLDDSFYINQEANVRRGERAYEARATSLALNYNTMQLKVCSNGCGQNVSIVNDPFEYQLDYEGKITSNNGKHFFRIDEVKGEDSTYAISGNFRCNMPCESFLRSVPNPLLYFTQVFYEYLTYLGIKVSPKFIAAKKSPNSQFLFYVPSKPLREIIVGLNHYSVNITADHLVFANGVTEYGADYNKGLALSNAIVNQKGCKAGCNVVDGSGLDRRNLVTANVLGNILKEIALTPSISSEFESSLPVMGQSGTLRRQQYLPKGVVVRAKTGTINGVRGLAGYIYSQRGKKYVFVIMQNNIDIGNAMVLERKLVSLINQRINR